MAAVATRSIETPVGVARVHVHESPAAPRGALVLGHGAGGGVSAPDLVAATDAALAEGFAVVLVEQPYRVAGRRSPAPARQLDAAWVAVVAELRASELQGLPVVTGGRSSGARVACRTAAEAGAAAVLCLAFPLVPPARRDAAISSAPRPSRLPELDAVTVPVLVIQGTNDRFGIPPATAGHREVVEVRGDHSLRSDAPALTAAIRAWLPRITP